MATGTKQSAADIEVRRQCWRRKDTRRNIKIGMELIWKGKAWRSALEP